MRSKSPKTTSATAPPLAEIAGALKQARSLVSADRRLAALRERAASLGEQLDVVRATIPQGAVDSQALRVFRELRHERLKIDAEIAATKAEVLAERHRHGDLVAKAIEPHILCAEDEIIAAVTRLLSGWAVLDEAGGILRRVGGKSRTHPAATQVALLIQRLLDQVLGRDLATKALVDYLPKPAAKRRSAMPAAAD